MFKSRYMLIFTLFLSLFSCAVFSEDDAIKKGRALQREQKFDEALQLYRDALKQAPTEDLYIEAGSLLGKMQKYDNAMTILERGLKDFPQSTSLKNLMALILVRKGDKARAKTLLEEVIAADADNSFALNWLEKLKKDVTSPATGTASVDADSETDSSLTGNVVTGAYNVDNSLPEEQQKELAVKLYQEMMELEKWELDSFKELHRKVIEKCPLTAHAEESCWRLSNLYMLGEDPPDFQSVIEVLEHLLKQYPDTPLLPDAKNRLLIACQQTNQMEKVVAIYEELFTRDPEPADDKTFMVRSLEFADALAAVGRAAEAQAWYEKVILRDDGKDSLEARVARERLAGGN